MSGRILLVVAVLTTTLAAGFHMGVRLDQGRIDAWRATAQDAQADNVTLRGDLSAAQQTLAQVQQHLADQQRDAEAHARAAEQTLATREAAQAALLTQSQRQTAALSEDFSHAACEQLDRVPVCPAVAERLWGQAPTDGEPRDHDGGAGVSPDPGHVKPAHPRTGAAAAPVSSERSAGGVHVRRPDLGLYLPDTPAPGEHRPAHLAGAQPTLGGRRALATVIA